MIKLMAEQLIGNSHGLKDRAKGLRFDIKTQAGEVIPAFVIRYDNQYFAYLNRCGHIAVQLDYMPGEFFSDDGDTLICATHGAEYEPNTGKCLGGPCYGIGLQPLKISHSDGQLFLEEESMTIAETNR